MLNSVVKLAKAHEPKAVRPDSQPKASHTGSMACGKAILVGEHAVVYGARAVAIPLPNLHLSMQVDSTPTAGDQAEIRMHLGGTPAPEKIIRVVREAMDLLQMPRQNLQIQGTSLVPIGAGLGSSASLCVALLRALTDLSGNMRSTADLAALATQLERTFHGNPSGLDTTVVAFEQPVIFRRGTMPTPLTVARLKQAVGSEGRWPFALIDSQLRASTSDMIARAQPFFSGPHAAERIATFDRLAAQVADALRDGHIALMQPAMNEAAELLTQAGVVPEALTTMMIKIRQVGALAVKPTGAGGGGMLLTLLDPACAAEQLRHMRGLFGDSRIHEVYL